jgi:hypothetical protein
MGTLDRFNSHLMNHPYPPTVYYRAADATAGAGFGVGPESGVNSVDGLVPVTSTCPPDASLPIGQ